MKRRSPVLPFLAFPAVVTPACRTAPHGGATIISAGAKRIIDAIRSIIGRIEQALDRRATARALAALNDRQLRDIGVTRWEIEELLHTGRFPERHKASGRPTNPARRDTH
jgi:uncharacterized protein YjiS (DUF1127 family)